MSAADVQRVVLITGCSSGFGALCAREFRHRGDAVVATMRDTAAQPFSADEQIDVRALDVTRADSIQSCVAGVLDDYGRIDVLINNAGIHLLGAMEDMGDDALRRVFETNFFGAINMARAVLPGMRQQGHGRIITVSSIGSLVGRVIDGAYCASKAALEIALEAMKYEVQRFGVTVSVVCPSAFRTNIGQKMQMPEPQPAGSPYQDLLAFRFSKVCEAVSQGGDPQDVVSLIAQVADDAQPRFRYIVGDKAQMMQQGLAGLDDAERQALITRLAQIEWWVTGDACPAPQEPSPAS